jgi:hypothetical protein
MNDEPITINLFQNHGGGPWLYVWHGVDLAVAGKSGHELSTDEGGKIRFAIALERALRDDFLKYAATYYRLAVESVRAAVAELDSPFEFEIYDRGLQQ